MIQELKPEDLRLWCDESQFEFTSTAELPPLTGLIGQERAMRALEFGVSMRSPGYNVYALGIGGVGKISAIQEVLRERAKQMPVPSDWCYVQDFAHPNRPRCLELPPGKGLEFRKDMEQLVQELRREIPQALESENFESEYNRIVQEVQRKRNAVLSALEQKAQEQGFTLQQGPAGLMVVPMRDGQPLTAQQYSQLSPEERAALEEKGQQLSLELANTLRTVRQLEAEGRQQLMELQRQVVRYVAGNLIAELREKYAQCESVVQYLGEVEQDIAEHAMDFRRRESESEQVPPGFPVAPAPQSPTDRYKVNVIIDNSQTEGAPVVYETRPTFHNLVGRIERRAYFGTLVTDFTMIKPGALHRANGGYLLLDAYYLLRFPFAYEALKRVLKNGRIDIWDFGEEYGFIGTATLDPEPIPLNVKVVLAGNPLIYYLLQVYDEEFSELFKVQADFDTQMDRTPEGMIQYCQFLKVMCEREGLAHFTPSGAARIIEYGSELVGDRKKLSTQFSRIVDIAREASYWARQNGHDQITREDVQRAIDEKIYRSNRIDQRIQEMIERGILFIDTQGAVVGQVNGLSVMQIGDYTFGKPSRVTARTYMGRGGVINIEREVRLSGPIHNKGVLILSGYLNGKYGQDKPISMSAQIGFEQLYEGVEGDSASSTELYALLSSLSGIPIKQGIAVTGSVNQHGQIQPIGGVNEKIAGFFDVCKARGLTGEQGVLIPKANVDNLMLREDIVEAVRQGQFHIYAVETIDEGIEILTGVPAGERQEDGTYPEGTVNYAVEERFKQYAEALRAFEREEKRKKQEDNDEEGRPPEPGPPQGDRRGDPHA